MILDGQVLEPGSRLKAGVCVVGTGMGGASVARRLCSAGQDVLLVEAGGVDEKAATSVDIENTGRPFGLPLTRCIELGGSSNRWHGICGLLDDIDFEPRPWIPDSGWPLRRENLDRYYDEGCKMLGVPREFEPTRLQQKLRDRLREFGFEGSVLGNKLVYYRNPPLRWKAPLLDLARSRKVRCLLNAPAVELVRNENGSRVAYLLIGVRNGPHTATIEAKTFIICAGALETPRLLLNSNGIGNGHGLVGRFLMDHPMGHYCKLGFRRAARPGIYTSLNLGDHVGIISGLMVVPREQRSMALPNHYLWIRPSVTRKRVDDTLLLSFLAAREFRDLSFRQVRGMLFNPDLFYRILVMRFGRHPAFRYGDLFFMTEQVPNRDSRVQVSGHRRDRYGYPIAQVNWQLLPADIDGFRRYCKMLFQRGLQNPEQYSLARVDDADVWNQTLTSAAHHLGTARMADAPSRGVVDANLKVFGMNNLFVCDGSVFPTAGSVNPGLTIAALGLRLGEYLSVA